VAKANAHFFYYVPYYPLLGHVHECRPACPSLPNVIPSSKNFLLYFVTGSSTFDLYTYSGNSASHAEMILPLNLSIGVSTSTNFVRSSSLWFLCMLGVGS
jgi:hypothetical protein